MASLLYQTIEQISREKHIEPDVIAAAIEDAMVVAARKYYKTDEDVRAKFNPDTGQVDVFAVRPVVEEVTDPKKEFTLAEAKRIDPNAEVGGEVLGRLDHPGDRPEPGLGLGSFPAAVEPVVQRHRAGPRAGPARCAHRHPREQGAPRRRGGRFFSRRADDQPRPRRDHHRDRLSPAAAEGPARPNLPCRMGGWWRLCRLCRL